MGIDASILFCGIDFAAARAATAMAVCEIERLEIALSLFREDSEICRLNRDQVLHFPTADMRNALGLALAVAHATGGLFDPTVQALWEAHVDWFTMARGEGLPPRDVLTGALAAVDWRQIELSPASVRLGTGQRITLNGLAQGYVTDRIAGLLRAQGFEHVLVDLGEQRALGPRRDGTPWPIAREDAAPFQLTTGALATSEGAGCILGAGGAAHHLFDPRTGLSAAHWRKITVHHESAAVADALSTAIYAATPAEVQPMLQRFAGVAVWAIDRDGRKTRWSSGVAPGVKLAKSKPRERVFASLSLSGGPL
jgi:thiamine biosynthesis lipoprotein